MVRVTLLLHSTVLVDLRPADAPIFQLVASNVGPMFATDVCVRAAGLPVKTRRSLGITEIAPTESERAASVRAQCDGLSHGDRLALLVVKKRGFQLVAKEPLLLVACAAGRATRLDHLLALLIEAGQMPEPEREYVAARFATRRSAK